MILLFFLACAPKAPLGPPAAADYFPLVEGAHWSYAATFNGREMVEIKYAVPLALSDGKTAIAFIPEEELEDDIVTIMPNMIGLGLYRYGGSGVETAEAFWRAEAVEVSSDDFQPLFAVPPQVGETVTFTTESVDRTVATVAGFETVTVPAGTFEDALKIELGQGSTAWFAPGVGLVRWVLVTGRVEELTSYEIPGR